MEPTDLELDAYLDEMLSIERSSEIEDMLRSRADIRHRATQLAHRRDQGGHTVGEIWRRRRLSCLSRSQLGSYLLGVADASLAEYVEFHLTVIGCRVCRANLDDLNSSQSGTQRDRQSRQRRYFESSAGLLPSKHDH